MPRRIEVRDHIMWLGCGVEYDPDEKVFTIEPPCGSNIEFTLGDMKKVMDLVPIPKEIRDRNREIVAPGPWVISLKCQEPHFRELADGRKKFDLRSKKKGRTFQTGQVVIMKSWDEKAQEYTGHYAAYVITYVLDTATLPESYGIDAGDCWVLGLQFPNSSYTPHPSVCEDMEAVTNE